MSTSRSYARSCHVHRGHGHLTTCMCPSVAAFGNLVRSAWRQAGYIGRQLLTIVATVCIMLQMFTIVVATCSRTIVIFFLIRWANKCILQCRPSFPPPQEKIVGKLYWNRCDYFNNIWKQLRPSAAQSPNTASSRLCRSYDKIALVLGTVNDHNFYHWVVENVYVAWMTAFEYSRYAGVDISSIAIFTLSTSNFQKAHGQAFDKLWNDILQPKRPWMEMTGCYRSVIYGSLYWSRLLLWPVAHHLVRRDPTAMSWTMLFSKTQRGVFLQSNSSPETAHQECLVLPQHHRLPSEVFNMDWNASKVGFCVSKHWMQYYPMDKQIATIVHAPGIISITGASLVWLLWLKSMSMVMIMQTPYGLNRGCAGLPETWHETTALHMGHATVSWRYCGPHRKMHLARPFDVLAFTVKYWQHARGLANLECVLY